MRKKISDTIFEASMPSSMLPLALMLLVFVSSISSATSPSSSPSPSSSTTTTTTTAAATAAIADPRYAEFIMQAQCQANCLAKTGEIAYSSDVTLLPIYSCTSERCRLCSAPCDTDIVNLVSPSNCKSTKCSQFDKMCHESCNLRFRLKQAHVERGELSMAPNPFGLQVQAPEMLCIDDPSASPPLPQDSMNGNNNNEDYDDDDFNDQFANHHRHQPPPSSLFSSSSSSSHRQRRQQSSNGKSKKTAGGKSVTFRWLARFNDFNSNYNNDQNDDSNNNGTVDDASINSTTSANSNNKRKSDDASQLSSLPPIVSVFTVRRENSKKLTIIGKIVGQAITITNLLPKYGYIFEVTSVGLDGIVQPAVASTVCRIDDDYLLKMAELRHNDTLSAMMTDGSESQRRRYLRLFPPVNGKFATDFFYHHHDANQRQSPSSDDDRRKTALKASTLNGVGVYVHWRPDPATYSCYYDVFILKQHQNGGQQQPASDGSSGGSTSSANSGYVHIRARTKETHNVLRLDSLDFDSNYTLRIFAADRLYRYQSSQSLDMEFVTPTCLVATNRNYTICGPEAPANVSANVVCRHNNNHHNNSNETVTTTTKSLSLIVNWTGDEAIRSSFGGYQVDVANDPIPELIGAVEMPSDWKSFRVAGNVTSLAIDDVLPNQIYVVQLRSLFAEKASASIVLRIETPGSKSAICRDGSADGDGSDYVDDAAQMIVNWTLSGKEPQNGLLVHAVGRYAANKSKPSSIDLATLLGIVFTVLFVAAIFAIIAIVPCLLRRARLIKQAKAIVDDVPMKYSTLYEMTSVMNNGNNGQNQKFDRFEVTWTQLSLLPHVLGEGAFGKVIHGQLLAPELTGSDGAADVAVKMLRDNATDEERLSLLSEIETMKRVRQVCGEHPNVVSLLACVTRNGLYSQPALVMDLCPFGSLRDYLRGLRGKSPREVANLCGKSATLFRALSHTFQAATLRSTTTNVTMMPPDYPSQSDSGFAMNSVGEQQMMNLIPTAQRLLLLSLEKKQFATTNAALNINETNDDIFTTTTNNNNATQQQQQIANVSSGKSGSCSTANDVGPDQNPPLFMLLLSFAAQICAGMEHLAIHKFVHRDLATRNVLVYDFDQVKISDFGLSRDIYEDAKYQKTTAGRLPIKWMAPEAIIDQMYTTASDVWSFGIVLWELVTLGATPYCLVLNQDLPRLLRGGHRLERPDNCPEDLYSVMMACWSLQADNRPTFSSLLEQIQSLHSKAERSLAPSVYEVEDYVPGLMPTTAEDDNVGDDDDDDDGNGSINSTSPSSLLLCKTVSEENKGSAGITYQQIQQQHRYHHLQAIATPTSAAAIVQSSQQRQVTATTATLSSNTQRRLILPAVLPAKLSSPSSSTFSTPSSSTSSAAFVNPSPANV